jgi:hypothetical protein
VPDPTTNVSKPLVIIVLDDSETTAPPTTSTIALPNPVWKSRNVPHIKTYYQLNHEGCSMDWFVVTPHSMSKAAWGEAQNSSHVSSLVIGSWESFCRFKHCEETDYFLGLYKGPFVLVALP